MLQADEQIKIYLKNKETGELTDHNPNDAVPVGFTLVKKIYKKRNIGVLMNKWRAAVEVAKLIGKLKLST